MEQPPQLHHPAYDPLAATATALLVLGVLLLASALTNRAFGHPSFFREAAEDSEAATPEKLWEQEEGDTSRKSTSFPTTGDGDDGDAAPTATAAAAPAGAAAGARGAACLLEEALPRELLVQVLAFLTPYEATRLAQASRASRDAAEAPEYWGACLARAGCARLPGSQEEETETETEEAGGRRATAATAAAATTCCTKLEFFRRAFLWPYALAKGHDGEESCRVVVHGRVYDVTEFLPEHPGGEAILLEHAGALDATTVFELSYHSARARRMMAGFLMWDPTWPRCLGKAGTILGLLRRARRPVNPAAAPAPPAVYASGAASPPTAIERGRIRPDEARSPPPIVHTLGAVHFD